MITDLPSSRWRCHAILPIVVVFPVPFTPTVRMTDGEWETSMWSSAGLATSASISSRRRARSSPPPIRPSSASCQLLAMAADCRESRSGCFGQALLRSGRRGLFALEAAGDYLRDAVLAHADAVENVGRLHRAALVGDDDELGPIAIAADQRQE